MSDSSNSRPSNSPEDKEPQRICLFGGTFDPIHLGHTQIAQAAVKEMDLDLVTFLPCRQSPHKIGEKHADSYHRLKMCELAIADHDWAMVDNFDLIAPEPCYSWRTAEAMHNRHPKADLYWLMGTDQWVTLHTWNNPDRLAKVVEFIVYDRGIEATPRDGFRMHPIHGNHPASATTIREKLVDGICQNWLNPDVLDYIQTNGLYDTSPKSDQAGG